MGTEAKPGGTFTFKGTSLTVNRIGFGGMSLAGPMAFGPAKDKNAVLSVLKEAIGLGVNHIDTSDYYGPHIANRTIKEALYPYPENLVITTKVGVKRTSDKGWPKALSESDLTRAIEDNLRNLDRGFMEIVNLRVGEAMGTNKASIAEPLGVLVKLKNKGLIKNIGLSNISREQYVESKGITEIVCVQNHYNMALRNEDAMVDELNAEGIAFVPFFPLGGFRPLQSEILDKAAATLGATAQQVALAWLLQRSPNILLIPGTSSVGHLRENVKAGSLKLPAEVVEELNQVGKR
ncbi:MAG: oxidoreductase [Fibrobacteres bacterium]|nr:oxidoreductase [Fibrobacterota bacterium]